MLGAIAIAAVTQAAAVDWTVNYSGKGSAWVGSSGVVVLAFAGSDYSSVITEKVVEGVTSYEVNLGAASALNGDGTKFTTNFKQAAKTATIQTADAPNSMFWVILSGGSTEAGSEAIWTAVTDVTGSQYTPPAQGSVLGLTSASFTNSGVVAVPEPTSGLLMLVGLAGLALRRRRA